GRGKGGGGGGGGGGGVAGANPPRHKSPRKRDPTGLRWLMGEGRGPAVAIGPAPRPPQHDLITGGKGTQGRRRGAPCRVRTILRPSQWRNLDCRQANFASIFEHEIAPVENPTDGPTGDLIPPADLILPLRSPIIH